MKQTILLFFVCLTFYQLPAQVKTRPLPAEQKVEAKAEDDERSLSVFPNPSNGIITVSLEGFENKKTELRIMNVIGNVVYQEVVQDPSERYTRTIDLNKLAKGLYYVKLETPTYSEVRKVVIR
ncbi:MULTISPECIES: T9SS type A sorting domain-containing protein [Rufibacter]|uniref:Secretion system C-terminal sorting domain-containing protein n=1 Tax=Rufibacter quisquiliarum TaxID=1549639 RepID=A0A839GHC5_9BACT|nr:MULTISPECIES: T9SS type A sorting domain-containing protein [Rufibacter]MBA9078282.1 hypothetical protein [Rufibacter quisquiliarum]